MWAQSVGLCFRAVLTQRENEFLVDIHWENRKAVLRWTLDYTFDRPEVLADVLESADDDFRVSNGVRVMFVDSGIQGNDVIMEDFLVT